MKLAFACIVVVVVVVVFCFVLCWQCDERWKEGGVVNCKVVSFAVVLAVIVKKLLLEMFERGNAS